MLNSDDRLFKGNSSGEENKITLLAIVGPTASGKSGLAMKIAEKFNGEIIAADSRTIYKGMDIGTAKPTKEDQEHVKHHGLDLIEPGKKYNAAKFKKSAEDKIVSIQRRGKLPILVGGTGLYIDSVLFDYSFIGRKLSIRHRLFYPWRSVEWLQKMIARKDWPMPQNKFNRRHLIATIRRRGQVGTRSTRIRPEVLVVGLLPPDEILRERIGKRAERIFKEGVIEETKRLIKIYGRRALQKNGGIVYQICLRVLKNELSQTQAIEIYKSKDWQYARRQKTWFKRNKSIKWFSDSSTAFDYLKSVLNT